MAKNSVKDRLNLQIRELEHNQQLQQMHADQVQEMYREKVYGHEVDSYSVIDNLY